MGVIVYGNLETLVRDALAERFPDADIDRVIIRPDLDSDGDKVLRITVVLEGHAGNLNREKLVGFVRHLKSRLATAECDEFPLLSFVERNEARKLKLESV